MKIKMIFPFFLLAFATACGRDGVARTDQKNYEIVQEGSANGVTSTIQGPGETLPPITGTNADTTTAFSIDPDLVASSPSTNAPGTLSGSMPPDAYTPPPPGPTYTPPVPRQEPATNPVEPPTTETAATETAAEPAPPAEPEEEEEEEEDPPPPTTTDTRGE